MKKPPKSSKYEYTRKYEQFLLEVKFCKGSLYQFVKRAWKVIVQNHRFVNSWHVKVLCDHLQAVFEGKIQNLLINIPPRHTKSLIVSVFWPAWCWAKSPTSQWLFTSRTQSVSIRDNRKSRILIESRWYQDRFPLEMADDQNAKSLYVNAKGGHRQATSAGSQGTGLDADYMVIDDLHGINDPEEQIAKDVEWVEDTFWTRGNTVTAPKVAIGQRVRGNDISGHILSGKAGSGWVALVLPMEYEEARRCKTGLVTEDYPDGFEDPRKVEGQILCPERFPQEWVDEQRAKRPGRHARLNQQNPTPAEGGIFKRAWLDKVFHSIEVEDAAWGTSCDTPFRKGKNTDYFVIQLIAKVDIKYKIVAQVRRRMAFTEMKSAYSGFIQYWSSVLGFTLTNNLLEAKASGDAILSELEDEINIVPYEPGRNSKEQRFEAVSPVLQAGNLELPSPNAVLIRGGEVVAHLSDDFTEEYREELGSVPLAPHDDQADTTTQYILNDLQGSKIPEPDGGWLPPEIDIYTAKGPEKWA